MGNALIKPDAFAKQVTDWVNDKIKNMNNRQRNDFITEFIPLAKNDQNTCKKEENPLSI